MRTLAIAVLATVLASATASADPKPKVRADKLFDDGRRYLANKEYELACTAFEESERADPAIGTELNIALCYEEWGHIASAYRAFIEAERLARLKKDDRAKTAHAKVEELAPKIPRLNVDIAAETDPSALFLFDGKEIDRTVFANDMLLDSGRHTVEARVPGQPPKIVTIDLANGEHKEIVIDVPKPAPVIAPSLEAPRNPHRFYGGIGLVAGGAVAIGVASIVAVIERNNYNDAVVDCPGGLCQTRAAYDATQNDRRRATYMTFVGGAGVALAAVGVYLIATSRGEARVVPVVAPGTVGVAIGGSL